MVNIKTTDEALKQYEERFNEPLSERYIANLDSLDIVSIVEECLAADLDFYQLQQKKYGEDIIL